MPVVLLALSAASAGPLAPCPATPNHIVDACGGCRPLFQALEDGGHRVDDALQAEIDACVGGALGHGQRRATATAKACLRESEGMPPKLRDWLTSYLDAHRTASDRQASDRQWAQCAAQVRHLDQRPDLCAMATDVTLERTKVRKGAVSMYLALENRCVRDVACAITVSATRSTPAHDGATAVGDVILPPLRPTRTAVRLKFPGRTRADVAQWSLGDLQCRYLQPLDFADAVADATPE